KAGGRVRAARAMGRPILRLGEETFHLSGQITADEPLQGDAQVRPRVDEPVQTRERPAYVASGLCERHVHRRWPTREGERATNDLTGLDHADTLPTPSGFRVAGDRDAKARRRLAFAQDLLPWDGALPLPHEGERNELSRTERPKAEIVELLLVFGQDDGPSLEINPG